MVSVVKRRGKTEKFDDQKLFNSVFSACRECELDERESKIIANSTVESLRTHFKNVEEINSTEIFGAVIEILAKEHEAVAFMYQTHRDMHDIPVHGIIQNQSD
jgi:transcriptional regulator NrdR family protein